MAIQRYRPGRALAPFEDIERSMESMERMMDRMFREWPGIWEREAAQRMWHPSLDVYDKKDSVVVRAEIPGMTREDINVSVEGNTLTISGERKAREEVKEDDYYRCEMTYGKFYRSIALPSTVDANKIDATYKDGVLEITLPKAEEVKPKKIEIKAKQ